MTKVNIISGLFIIHVMKCDLERKISLYLKILSSLMDQLTRRGFIGPEIRGKKNRMVCASRQMLPELSSEVFVLTVK